MVEDVQYNTHFDWIIAGARFSYYVHGHYEWCSLMPGHCLKTNKKFFLEPYFFSLAQDCTWKMWPLVILVKPRNRLWAINSSFARSSIRDRNKNLEDCVITFPYFVNQFNHHLLIFHFILLCTMQAYFLYFCSWNKMQSLFVH